MGFCKILMIQGVLNDTHIFEMNTTLLQGQPWQSVYFRVKILGRKKVLRIIYPMDFLFPEKHISFAITKFFRF